MKKQFKYLILAFVVLFMASCEDEDKNPFPTPATAPFAFIDIVNPVINVTDLANSAFEATLTDPSGKVTSYALSVSRNDGAFAPLVEITSFPASISFKAADLAAALGLSLADINAGDKFDFDATITNASGVVATIDDLNGDSLNPGERQAFQYTTFISCPFVQADAIGTYQITRDDFGSTVGDDIFEVIAGDNPNQIIMVNPFDHPNPDDGGAQSYTVAIDVDPVTGIATISKQAAWHCDNFGCPYGEGRVETSATSFVFSCVGVITGVLKHTVDLGSFGDYAFSAQKI